MAFSVYTDDGVLHEGVPHIEMPANAAKTVYNRFIAENEVPAEPEGELAIDQNGEYNVAQYATVRVAVEGGSVETEEKTATPSAQQQEILPTAGKLLSKVTVLPVQTEQAEATPTEEEQQIAPSEGKFLSRVTVNRIPQQYIIPSGKKEIIENGDNIDVSQYASVKVAVQAAGAPTMTADYAGEPVVVGTDVSTLSEFVNIYITFSDGTEIALGDDDVGPFDISGSISVEGDNVLTVSFGGMTAQFTVEGVVPAPILDHLTATYTGGTVPAGTTLAQLTGITVKAVYSDSSQVTLTASQYQLTGTLTPGSTNTVTVTGLGEFAGKTATFSVTVEAEQIPTTKATGTYTNTGASTVRNFGPISINPESGTGFVTEPNKVTIEYNTGTVPMGFNIYKAVLERTGNAWTVTYLRNGNNQHNALEGDSAEIAWGTNYTSISVNSIYYHTSSNPTPAKSGLNAGTTYDIVCEVV